MKRRTRKHARNDGWDDGPGDGRRRRVARSVATSLVQRVPELRRESLGVLAAVLVPWLVAGYTLDDLHHALRYRPNRTPWPPDAPADDRWLVDRMLAWLGDDGAPVPSLSQRTAREHEGARPGGAGTGAASRALGRGHNDTANVAPATYTAAGA